MKQKLLHGSILMFLLFSLSTLTAQSVFINEIHYDNAGTDVDEAIEIAGPAGTDLTGWSVVLYNGSNNSTYNTTELYGIIPDQQTGFGTQVITYSTNGIQNGSPDGLALVNAEGEVIQFLSYEGTMDAADGPAAGMTSIDIGVSQDGSEAAGLSLQLGGEGISYSDFTWQTSSENTFGESNKNQVVGTPEEIIFINEIHYDNAATDEGEAIEVAGTAGLDLSAFSLVLYNGSNGAVYNTTELSGVIPDQDNGFGTLYFTYPSNGIQNGSPDGISLVKGDEVIQFLSYEGTMVAVGGPADGMTSEDIGVSQTGSEPVGHSLQLNGTGNNYLDFEWNSSAGNTFELVNTNQSFGEGSTEPEPEPEPKLPPAPAVDVVFINEIHYDNTGTDEGEGLEVAGTSGTDLSAYSVLLYNGNGGGVYNTINLEGVIPSQQNGYGTVSFMLPSNGLQNGAPDGLALVKGDEVIQFLSYEGEMVATSGAASGMTSTDIGLEEGSSTPVGYSLQLTGEGSYYDDFTWAPEAQNTFGNVNTAQNFISPEPVLFINEFHYDTEGTDSGEAIEVAGTAGLDLSEYSIIFYNGNNGSSYGTIDLEGVLENQQSGYGAKEFYFSGIQNGSPDGFALVKGEEVLQFLSYEGTFTAASGPAAGMESTEVGVSEASAPAGTSLQLGGTGFTYEDFVWQESVANTFGTLNINQSFGGEVVEPEPEVPAEQGTIAYARAAEVGTKLIVEGTLTVSDEFGNTAYIQDETGGIAIFGDLVTEAGLYQVGDSLRVTGTRAVYNELIQISDVESVEYLGVANEPIEPVNISLSQLEDYRGQLVRITDVSFPDPGQLLFGNANYEVTDAADSTGELRIDADVSSLVGKLQPERCTEVVGVVGRYNNVNQLLPRNETDLPCAEPYDPTFPGSDISKDVTFDAVTWNIEWFGDEANSPAARNENSDEIQKEAVKAVLLELDADVIAVQEISDEFLFAEMVGEMEGYDFILSDATSYPDEPGGQKVGFIYKTETVDVTDTRAMFTSVHPFYEGDGSLLQDYPESADRFYASGRLPFLMEANVTIDDETQEMTFVALHARANSSTGAQSRYDMRKYDVEVLKDSLDMYYPNEHVMILGDFNDDVDFTVANVSTSVSTYVQYTTDNENYTVLTSVLSEQGFRSYAIGDYADMIDHIMVTDELDDNYIEGSARVHYEFYNSDYTYTTSDHFPVSVRLMLEELEISFIETTDGLCSDAETATATVYAEGGIAPYTYLWSDGQETQTATELSAGSYTVEVTDSLGNSTTATVTIETTSPVALTMIEDQKVYLGYTSDCTTLSAASVTGGTGDYSYEWSTGETSETITVCPGETTTYSLTVTDEKGCTAEGMITVTAIDVSCGNKGDKVQVCHNGNSICVAPQAVPAFLRKGAKLGSCDGGAAMLIEEVSAYPNPTRSNTSIRVTAAKNMKAQLVIYSLNGNSVQEEKISIKKGSIDFPLNLKNLRQGVYLLKIHAEDFETEALKIVKY